MDNQALVIVDAQRCFMPAEEGVRLNVPGFGELGVEGGQNIVAPLNQLTDAFNRSGLPVFTTQDQHPEETAHFSAEPNFVNTWPKHGRAGTPGGELHPDLLVAQDPWRATRTIKGDVVAQGPEDDTSYTGALAHDKDGELLPDALRRLKVTAVTVGGLALGDGAENKLCVDSTAVDLFKQGFEVTVVTDAVEAVLPENRAKCLRNLAKLGLKLATTAEVRELVADIYR